MITEFMQKIQEKLENDELANSTIKVYMGRLKELNGQNNYNSFGFLRDSTYIDNKIKHLSENTKKGYYITIIKVLTPFKTVKSYKTCFNHYYDKMMMLNKGIREETNTNEKTEKQNENWLDLKDVEKIFYSLTEKVQSMKKEITASDWNTIIKWMTLALFVLQPPRRNKDYIEMVAVKKYNDKMPNTKNYLSVSEMTFIFNVYKTSKTYGKQIIPIENEELKATINKYLNFHPLLNGKKITATQEIPFLCTAEGHELNKTNSLTRIINSCFDDGIHKGKHIGSQLLRHIWLSSKYDIDKMKYDAKSMAHSMAQQKEYLKK